MKNITKILIGVVVILAALLIAQNLYYFSEGRVKGQISSDEASKKAMDYINNMLSQQGHPAASLVEIKSENGIYAIKIKVEDQDYTSYITKDGKVLFPQGIVIPENTEEPKTSEITKKDKTEAMLFVMSFCPYGNQAEDLMKPVIDLIKNKADISLHYVVYSNYNGGGAQYCIDKDSKYCSMHGIQEMNQDVRELCVQKYQKDKLWDFVLEINSKCTSANVDSCWAGVAKGVGVDTEKVKKCQKEEALLLAEAELQLNQKYGISGSPQLVINDAEYQGNRTAEAYKQGICSGFNNPPTECSQKLDETTEAASGGCE